METIRGVIRSERMVPFAVLALLTAWTAVAPAPWVAAGDSGELAAAAWDLGIPHNPGYPLLLLLGKAVATLLPLGSVAMRVALLSGLCTLAAAAVLLLVLLPRLVGGDRGLAAAGAVFAGVALVSGRYRSLFREGEVYGTALLLLITLAAVAVSGAMDRRRGAALLGAVAGLAILGHYQAAVCLVPIVLLLALHWARGGIRPAGGRLLAFLAAALASAPLLLYLPLRSLHDPLPDWGNPQTLANFVFHVTGGEHLGTRLGFADAWQRSLRLAGEGAAPWGWLILAAAIGAVVAIRRFGPWPILASVVAGETVYALLLNRVEPVITPFLPITGLLGAVLAGIGLAAAARMAGRARGVLPGAAVLLAAALVAVAPGFRDRDLPSAADAYPQVRASRLAAAVPPGGIAVVAGDATAFPLVYLQGVGGARPDLTVLDRTNSVFRYPGWEAAKIDADSRRLLEDRLLDGRRPVIALGHPAPPEFGSRRAALAASVVAFAGVPRPAPLPDPLPLLGLPSGGMVRRTVAEGVFLSLSERPVTARGSVPVLLRIARWGERDPYLLNEAGIRLFGAGARRAAVAVFLAGSRSFPDVPELAANLAAAEAAPATGGGVPE